MYYMIFPVLITLISLVNGEIYFEEKFVDDSWQRNWIQSEYPGKEFGKFVLSHGKFWNNPDEDLGLQTSQDAKFYAISRKFPRFSNGGKSLVIQFSVKHEQSIDCGGGYIKLFDCTLDQKNLHGESPYLIMFGPDICGPGTKKVHVIFSYNGKPHLINKDIRCKDDEYTHLYTLIINPDNTYEVLIDNETAESGDLEADWDFLPPRMIKDPSQSKPIDWDDNPTIPDPEDEKPVEWDRPEHIPDPEAIKPEDWDDDMDGEWEAPMIDNPEYKGEWKPKEVDNPNYKGPWIHPEIKNPDYTPDAELYRQREICIVGFDLWQVKSGSIFDNVLVTDNMEDAKAIGAEIIARQVGEKAMKDKKEIELNTEGGSIDATEMPSNREEGGSDSFHDEAEAEEDNQGFIMEKEDHDEL